MANILSEPRSNLTTLLTESEPFNCLLDPQQFEATKVYLLYLILQQLGGLTDADICDLRDTVKQYDYLSNYQRQAMWLTLLGQIAENVGVTDEQVSEEAMREGIDCWCQTSKQSLALLEMILLYSILGELGQV